MAKAITQGEVLRALHTGDSLVKVHINEPPSDSKTIYRLARGRTVRAALVLRMIAEGLLIPNEDGLFGDSQSFRLARGEEIAA